MDPEILLCADARYVQALVVALSSTLDNAPDGAHVTVVLDGYSARDRAALERIANRRPHIAVSFLDGDRFDLSGLAGIRHLTPATYHRLFVDEIVPSASRVLFLDADLLVRHPLGPLFELDLEENAVGAVRDMAIADQAHPWSDSPSKGDEPYFNAGVLVIDLDRWRELGVGREAIALLRTQPMGNADQDALNSALRDQWKELDPTWNVQGALLLLHEQPPHPWREEMRSRAEALMSDPAIVHFSGIKPWRPFSHHPFTREWRRTLRRSGPVRLWPRHAELAAETLAVRALEMVGARERRERRAA
ncbi:MAG TPA: glycosyltransferase family 8 protein [Gaiellaceae bacterium]|nr:glycosyltransferase family 8 protein [Gaiellaceae bacterium]